VNAPGQSLRAADAVIAVVDFESTGVVAGHPNEPWQIALVAFEGGRAAARSRWESLLRVGDRPFSPRAPGLHHRLRDRLRTAPRLEDIWPELRPWILGRPLAAHNAATERSFLRRLAPLHPLGPWIDTLKLVRIAYPDLPSHTLEDVASGLGLLERVRASCPDRGPHDALFDATACAVLLEHLLEQPGWRDLDVADLARARPDAFHRRLRAR
jgi:DNA polymerase III epsilon subunit-like protein